LPHFKSLACKTRLHSAAGPGDLVGELTEIVGFQSIEDRDGAADDRVGDFYARREAILAQARLDAERWVDDGGSFSPEAVAEAMALPTPKEHT
jgi:hypothetical protein